MWIDCILIFLQSQVLFVCCTCNSSINCDTCSSVYNEFASLNECISPWFYTHSIKNHQPRRPVEVRLVLFKKCVQTVATTNSMRHRPQSTLTQGTTLDTQTRESRGLLLSGKVANCAPRFICKNASYSILDSEEIRASQVEPVKPAKSSESSNPVHVRHGEIDFSRRLTAIFMTTMIRTCGNWDCLQRIKGVFQDLSQ